MNNFPGNNSLITGILISKKYLNQLMELLTKEGIKEFYAEYSANHGYWVDLGSDTETITESVENIERRNRLPHAVLYAEQVLLKEFNPNFFNI